VEKTNLTLSIDAATLRKARKAAIDRDTSVNELVRQYIERIASEAEARAGGLTEMRKLFRTTRARTGGVRWTRDELHER
jgi:hypothetical protein